MATSSENYNFADAMAAQHSFANKYSLEDPVEAASAYARYLAEHTRQQLQSIDPSAAASVFSQRRGSGGDSYPSSRRSHSKTTPSLTPESSSDSSISRSDA